MPETFTVSQSTIETDNLPVYSDDLTRRARAAAGLLATTPSIQKNGGLLQASEALESQAAEVLAANALDLALGTERGLTTASLDRLRLSTDRIRAAAAALREVAALP